ncbi:hypothetical protein ACQR1I_19835 [Bradyrhizobium sp. HKCCYLS2038]|uniref:hypothetical protein n=1 Tax=Bradyrhizobium sp. HKCCYLS2038 TaxID=3420764 RepID=UPI003EBC24B0
MALPPKSYFHLDEIANCWGASIPDFACYTLDGLLEIAVMTIGTRVETGRFEAGDRGMVRILESERILHGPQLVVSSDLWPIFRVGSGAIARFKPNTPDGFIDLASDEQPIRVRIADLLVTRRERDRFEAAHGIGTTRSAEQPTEANVQSGDAFLHRNNYAEVVLNGEIFRLGILQASVVRELHHAAQSDNPWRHGKELLMNCNASTMRMVDLFKAKRNWRTLIVSDGRGYYRLNVPARAAARTAHRAYRRFAIKIASQSLCSMVRSQNNF